VGIQQDVIALAAHMDVVALENIHKRVPGVSVEIVLTSLGQNTNPRQELGGAWSHA
jgi:hypothetical protein